MAVRSRGDDRPVLPKGITQAGRLAERDEPIRERIFTPPGLRTAGLRPNTTLGKFDAPLGHMAISGKTDHPPKSSLAVLKVAFSRLLSPSFGFSFLPGRIH
jgi:hypothetical protein